MAMKKILLVEGKDDENFIKHIWKAYALEIAFEIKNKEGIEKVLEETDSSLVDASDDLCLGIVIDADQDLNARWDQIRHILQIADYQNIPTSPDANGTIIQQQFKPTFGVWIMPDNVTERGMLEDFLAFLVPDKETNKTWLAAEECSQQILTEVEDGKRFSEIHLSKAKIHAYLAWQEDPGKPFGLALTAKYLQPLNPHCEIFVNWLKRLFIGKENS